MASFGTKRPGLVIKQLAEIQRDPGKPPSSRDAANAEPQSFSESHRAIPFRASKLTFLLRESLAGNSRTFMVGAVSPASISADETISTLRFASSVKRVKTVALQNVNKKQEAVASLQAEVARLAEMLQNAGAQGAGDATVKTIHDDLEERERLLQEMTKSHGQQLAEANFGSNGSTASRASYSHACAQTSGGCARRAYSINQTHVSNRLSCPGLFQSS
eukprot:Skav223541  [mRNA]  locus=scaffold4327:79369:84309:- [translate_table: standard]